MEEETIPLDADDDRWEPVIKEMRKQFEAEIPEDSLFAELHVNADTNLAELTVLKPKKKVDVRA